MKKLIIVLIGIILLVGCSTTSPKETVIKKIQQFLPSVKGLPPDLDKEETLIGHFADPNPALFTGGLSGCDIYLFPDKTYFYIDWADISPEHIADKGIWIYKNGLLTLQSDNLIPKKYQPKEKNYIPMLFPYKGKDWFLIMGLEREFSYYKEEAAKDNDESQLLVCTLGKLETITNDLKGKLFTKYWRSWFWLDLKLDELLELNNKTIKLNQKDTIAWYIKGDTLCTLGRYKESIEAFDEAIKLSPELFDAWYYRARLYSLQKDKQKSLSDLAQAISLEVELKEKAKNDHYFKWLWGNEEFKNITFIAGYELCEAALQAIAENRFDEAKELCNNALKSNPAFDKELCNTWWNKGYEFESTGLLEKALVCYDNASECYPKDIFILFNKVEILNKLGKYDEAIKVYGKAIELEPKKSGAWFRRARIYSLKKDKTNTLNDLAKAISLEAKLKVEVKKDKNFQWLWEDEEFKKLTQ
ncbi:MAG: tetratricopeptide repeat protein [Planctomycetota bacterium]